MARTKKVTDDAILHIILETIVEVGATEFSLEDLSKKTGLSPATMLQRFGSKKAILHKALELANQNLDKTFTNHVSTAKSALHKISDMYIELCSAFRSPKDVAKGLDILKLDITEKKLNTITRSYFDIRRKKILSLLSQAIDQGEISDSISIIHLAENLEALWQGGILQWALIGNGSLNSWLETRLNSFFDLLKKDNI